MLSSILAITVAGYAAVVLAAYVFQRNLIYFPSRERPEPAAWGVPGMHEVAITPADRVKLQAWWRAPGASAPLLVYLHGNAGHIGHRASKVRRYLDEGWGVLLLSWRGYGGSEGSPSEEGLLRDARAAIAFAGKEGGEAPLILYGESLGTAIAVAMALEEPPAALVLEAPLTSAVAVGRLRFPFLPVGLMLKDRLDSLSRIGALRAPLLIVHGTEDDIIPVSMGRRLFEAAPEPKVLEIVEGAGHNDLEDFGLSGRVVRFVSGTSAGAAREPAK